MGNADINRHEWIKAVAQDGNLPASASRIAIALWSFASDESGQLNPSLKQLSNFMNRDKATIKRSIAVLVKAGWLARTEGRGCGNMTCYTMLMYGKAVAQTPRKKGATVQLHALKKGATVHLKGCNGATSYNNAKQPLEQRAQATSEPPSPHLHAVVHHGGDAEVAWNDWLADNGHPSLNEIGQPTSDANGTGSNMPWRWPPSADEQTATRIAEKRVWWLINQRNERARAEVRYAAE